MWGIYHLNGVILVLLLYVPPKQVGFVPPFGGKDTKSREQNKINLLIFYAETEYLR